MRGRRSLAWKQLTAQPAVIFRPFGYVFCPEWSASWTGDNGGGVPEPTMFIRQRQDVLQNNLDYGYAPPVRANDMCLVTEAVSRKFHNIRTQILGPAKIALRKTHAALGSASSRAALLRARTLQVWKQPRRQKEPQ